jgi:hypothetical protein
VLVGVEIDGMQLTFGLAHQATLAKVVRAVNTAYRA